MLRKAIAQADLEQGHTKQELEHRFRQFLKKHRLPLPQFNAPMRIKGAAIPGTSWKAAAP